MTNNLKQPEQRIQSSGISWETYQTLLSELGDASATGLLLPARTSSATLNQVRDRISFCR